MLYAEAEGAWISVLLVGGFPGAIFTWYSAADVCHFSFDLIVRSVKPSHSTYSSTYLPTVRTSSLTVPAESRGSRSAKAWKHWRQASNWEGGQRRIPVVDSETSCFQFTPQVLYAVPRLPIPRLPSSMRDPSPSAGLHHVDSRLRLP